MAQSARKGEEMNFFFTSSMLLSGGMAGFDQWTSVLRYARASNSPQGATLENSNINCKL